MKNFKIAQPRTLRKITSFLAEKRDGVALLAGGTDLLGEMKQGVNEPEAIIDLKNLRDLSYIRKEDDFLKIGALTTLNELAEYPGLADNFPGLNQALWSIATPQLRNMGTVGGNLCQRPRCWYYRDAAAVCRKKGGSRCYAVQGRNKYHAVFGGGICYIVHPSDLAPILIALKAEATISSAQEERSLPLSEFFTLPRVDIRRENVLQPNELLKEIRVPLYRNGHCSIYLKLKERGTWDFAVVSAAVWMKVENGAAEDLRIVLGGVAPVPWRLEKAEEKIKGKKITEQLVRQAVKESLKDARSLSDNEYKLDLVETAVVRASLAVGAN
ncbi:MAG: FAD binding domain-containing protein [Acidobacteriota bacterium]